MPDENRFEVMETACTNGGKPDPKDEPAHDDRSVRRSLTTPESEAASTDNTAPSGPPSLPTPPGPAAADDSFVLRTLTQLTFARAWKAGLTGGGLLVITFAASVGYLPELEFQASATILAACAAAGLVLVLILVLLLLIPAILWVNTAGTDKRLAPLWGSEKNRRARLALGFALPVVLALGWALVALIWCPALLAPTSFRLRAANVAWFGVPAAAAAWWSWRCGGTVREWGWRAVLYVVFAAVVAVEFIVPAAVVAGLLRLSPTADSAAVLQLLSTLLVPLIGNTVAVALGGRRRNVDVQAVLMGAMVAMLLTTTRSWTFVPRRVMQVYALGDLRAVTLVLDRQGCDIARQLGGSPTGLDAGGTCRLAGVDVPMRLGTQYLVTLPRGQDTTRFIVSKKRVVSWTLPKLPAAKDVRGRPAPPPTARTEVR